MIKAIFFDLDGTLRQNEPRGSQVFAEHAAQLGLRVREDDRLRAMRWEHYYWANSRELKQDRARYDGNDAEFWTRYSHRQLVALGASGRQAGEMAPRLRQYMDARYNPQSSVPEEIPGVLRHLQNEGYALAIISNRREPYQEEVDALGLAPYFAFSLASGEIQIWKPDPGVFLHACQRVPVEPAEAMYVGDNYFADVVGARGAGLMPVLYDPLGIFDDPECAVIRSFTELFPLLSRERSMPDEPRPAGSTG